MKTPKPKKPITYRYRKTWPKLIRDLAAHARRLQLGTYGSEFSAEWRRDAMLFNIEEARRIWRSLNGKTPE